MLVEVRLIVPESIHPQPVLDGVCSGDLGLAKSAKEQRNIAKPHEVEFQMEHRTLQVS